MTDFAPLLAALRRPRILLAAARAGLAEESRLRRSRPSGPGGSQIRLGALIAEESALEAYRAAGLATYSSRRHIAVLTALLAEARLSADPALS
ncbi:DUF6477 family protein [Amaricoccus solimangrovi]|uniref:Uncharacterized protein n=1 Tax=Amaricoccus solimangrovi TaxID=2589815 RepID=A0A501WDC6_9RHOB|nr:DUF6477 family protein [Amaricoccus solimangrovi]TPE47388.1 hypothetical protein FJM51_20165 [Amaricoccus solimangrovi]